MQKSDILARIRKERLIALLRVEGADDLREKLQALHEGGIRLLELPLTAPAVPDYLQDVAGDFPDCLLGLGTVTDTATARRGILAGARFISTPGLRPAVILLCRRHRVPVICGAHSVEEIDTAIEAGADAIKLYPSKDRFGPTHVREIRARYPDTPLFPVGGVNAGNLADFLASGADALFVASGLTSSSEVADHDALEVSSAASLTLLTERSRELTTALVNVTSAQSC